MSKAIAILGVSLFLMLGLTLDAVGHPFLGLLASVLGCFSVAVLYFWTVRY